MMKMDGKPWFVISIKITTGRPEGAQDRYIAFHGRKNAFKEAARWLLSYWKEVRGWRT